MDLPTLHRVAAALIFGLSIVLPAGGSLGAEMPESVAITQVDIGFEGLYKVGMWTSLHVRLVAGTMPFEGHIRATWPDGDGVEASYTSEEVTLQAGQSTTVTLLAKPGRSNSPLTIACVADRGGVTTKTFSALDLPDAVPSSDRVLLGLGGTLDLAPTLQQRLRRRGASISHRALAWDQRFPHHWLGYQAVDVVFLTTSRLTSEDLAAAGACEHLADWVEQGGTLIVTVAAGAELVYAAQSPLSKVLPGSFVRLAEQRELTGLEQFAAASTPVGQRQTPGAGFSVPMAVVANVQGKVEASEGFGDAERAAVVRQGVGLGRVILITLDVDQPPFKDWTDQSRLLNRILDFALGEEADDSGRPHEIIDRTSLGFDDLSGQLRNSLDQFPRVRLIPFSLIALLMTAYLMVVGPVDFWILRWRRRLQWTWLTMPSIALGFTALAITMAVVWKGRGVQLNQASIVDVDASTGVVGGTSWSQLYAPSTSRFSIRASFADEQWISQDIQQATTWFGLPGDGFGGMDSRLKNLSFSQTYQVTDFATTPADLQIGLESFPLAAWSSRSLICQWWSRVDWSDRNVAELRLAVDGQLTGSVANPFPFPLQNCQLMYDRWAYRLGTLAPQQAVRVADNNLTDLHALMTRRKVVSGRNVRIPWYPTDTDVERILMMLMFYDAAKGRAYTGLQHRFQHTLDLSDQLQMKRAVLVGKSDRKAAQLDAEPASVSTTRYQHVTFYRVILPVRHEKVDLRD